MALKIGQRYNLSIYPDYLFKHTEGLTFIGEVASSETIKYGVIAADEHRKVFSTLPNGTINDASSYSWYVFETMTGQRVVYGSVWIKTITGLETKSKYVIEFVGDNETHRAVLSQLQAINVEIINSRIINE